MMQDTVLNLCKDSVKDFVKYILQFIPNETKIHSTAVVKNLFIKKDDAAAQDEYELGQPIPLSENDLAGVQNTKKWINGIFTKDKNPEPLYVLDLIMKPGALIPTFSTIPSLIV
jgi:hypothetical protein